MISIPTLHGTDSELKRQEIKAYFQKADPLHHPIIFYYGHTATFFINKFKLSMFSLFCQRKSHNIIGITVWGRR